MALSTIPSRAAMKTQMNSWNHCPIKKVHCKVTRNATFHQIQRNSTRMKQTISKASKVFLWEKSRSFLAFRCSRIMIISIPCKIPRIQFIKKSKLVHSRSTCHSNSANKIKKKALKIQGCLAHSQARSRKSRLIVLRSKIRYRNMIHPKTNWKNKPSLIKLHKNSSTMMKQVI